MPELDFLNADILGLDAQDNPVLWVEVKADNHPVNWPKHRNIVGQDDLRQATAALAGAKSTIPYVMFVDRALIQVRKWTGSELSEPIVTLPTASVLSAYEPEFEEKPIFGAYMERLVEAWLRDIAYNWRSPTPPHIDEFAKTGLAEFLKNGTTVSATLSAA